MVLIARIIEYLVLVYRYGWNNHWSGFEALGIVYDFGLLSCTLLLYYAIFYWLSRKKVKRAYNISLILICLLTCTHFLILYYFIHELAPLDIFFYKYGIREMYFTATTANVPFILIFVLIGVLTFFPLIIFKIIKAKTKNRVLPKKAIIALLLGLLVFIVFQIIPSYKINNFIKDKSGYFYAKSIQYLFTPKYDFSSLSDSTLYFSAYFWNKEKGAFKINSKDVLAFGK